MCEISFVIRSIPEREEMLGKTVKKFSRPIVIMDKEHRGVIWSTVRALVAALDRSEWICILPDDFIYCRDFENVVSGLLRSTNQETLIFYSQAKPKGRIVEKHGELVFLGRPARQLAVAPAYKKAVALAFYNVLSEKLEGGAKKDNDGVAADVLRKFNSAVVWPNLCDHIGHRSYLGNSWKVCGKERKSFWFPGENWKPDIT